MEEKCFIVKKDNPIYNDYFKWWDNRGNLSNKWTQFKKIAGIESESFVPRRELYIVPTENDLNNFGKMFIKEEFNEGLRKFKANSSIQKMWENFIDNNVVLVSKPNFLFDFIGSCISGRMQSRLFHYEDKVYASISGDFYKNFKIPNGYEEIKKSEFYQIIELIEGENDG